MFLDLVTKNRSYRRFVEGHQINLDILFTLINYARLSPCGSNRQALRYYLACEPELNNRICDSLLWAMYLKNWD